MDDAEAVAVRKGAHHYAEALGGVPLAVVPAGDDAVEKFAARAVIHHDVHVLCALVRIDEADDVGVAAEMVKDGDLAAHVLDIFLAHELPLGDRLACRRRARLFVRHEVGGAELTFAENLRWGRNRRFG